MRYICSGLEPFAINARARGARECRRPSGETSRERRSGMANESAIVDSPLRKDGERDVGDDIRRTGTVYPSISYPLYPCLVVPGGRLPPRTPPLFFTFLLKTVQKTLEDRWNNEKYRFGCFAAESIRDSTFSRLFSKFQNFFVLR